ncbi:hypothetical protein ABTX34_16915 [Streptomyces sp. NPDC096538]|uniref:hypothetical protein n=1 Tax=Streptomyces sp. NPDC096538 TaxID=3155427 RepID=UPI0033334667
MSNDQTPREQATEAVADFDRAMHDPARRGEAMAGLFRSLGEAANRHAEGVREARERWRNRPEAKARRSAAARKAAETRTRKRAAERAAELAEWEGDLQVPEVTCPHTAALPFGERECALEPGHAPDAHESHDGQAWDADDCDENCGVACGY